MQSLPPALAALGAYKQFIINKGKVPLNPTTLEVANPHDPSIWVDHVTACATATVLGEGYGVGFVLTKDDPFFAIDADKCRSPDGTWSDDAMYLFNALPDAAKEISQSGRGAHIFACAELPEHSCKNTAKGLELYHTDRYIALTGTGAIGDASVNYTAEMVEIVNSTFPPSEQGEADGWRDGPVEEWAGPTDDTVLLSKMLGAAQTAAQAFGSKASFRDLWENNEVVLARAYPVQNEVDPYDRSSADAALAQHLAFWTGKDHARMERLMRQSALVRPKWDKHKSYMQRTVSRAVSQQEKVYSKPGATTKESGAQFTSGCQMLFANQLVDYFEGCTYVQDLHRMLVPNGTLLKPEQFKAVYGGYIFSLDAENEKTTRNAFEAFTENQAVRMPKVTTTCFRPEIPPGTIVSEEGVTMVNIYVPANVDRRKGDASFWYDFIKRLWGDDWIIAMTYMASCCQNPGKKFQWAMVNIGAEGNGKSFVTTALACAVGRRYTHYPNANDIDNKFNGWTSCCLLAILEELTLHDRHEVLEVLKPIITNLSIEIQRKGADQRTGDNRLTLWINSNYIGAIPITVDSRRYCMLHCKQRTAADIERDFPDDYLKKLYDWANNDGGWAIIAEELYNFIPDPRYDPAGACQRAPVTSSTQEAVAASLGSIEQEVAEAIDEGKQGFSGGWVSGHALDKLLRSMRAERKIPQNKRRAMMQSLGYDWHPALREGRVNNTIAAEGGKPKIYIQKGHIHANLTTPAEVAKHYMAAQSYPDMMVNASEVVR